MLQGAKQPSAPTKEGGLTGHGMCVGGAGKVSCPPCTAPSDISRTGHGVWVGEAGKRIPAVQKPEASRCKAAMVWPSHGHPRTTVQAPACTSTMHKQAGRTGSKARRNGQISDPPDSSKARSPSHRRAEWASKGANDQAGKPVKVRRLRNKEPAGDAAPSLSVQKG